MPKKAVRALVSGGIVIAALSLLFYTTARDGAQLYKHVNEVTGDPQAWYGKNLQLHGFAKEDRKSTRLNSSHSRASRMPSSA